MWGARRAGGTLRVRREAARPGAMCAAVVAVALVCATAGVWGSGCGNPGMTTSPAASPPSTSITGALAEAVAPTPIRSQELGSETPPAGEATDFASVDDCFAFLAAQMAPLAVYAPEALPDGALVDTEYFPLLSCTGPDEYQGPELPNPLLHGPDDQASAEVLVRIDDAWVLFLQNFRGDLGDVTGTYVGDVQGHPAHSYDLAGGMLVQWSDSGRWYGVFSREIPAARLVSIALNMQVLQP